MQTLQLKSIQRRTQEISDQHFGDHALDALSGAGCTAQPKLALVFINPTRRNISTAKNWHGLKAPWIGCANIWQLFADANLIDGRLNGDIQEAKTNWTEQFAAQVYEHIAQQEVYITNIVKWAGLDATLPEKDKVRLYAPLLRDELGAIQPKRIVAFGQLTYDAIMHVCGVKNYPTFGIANESMLTLGRIISISTEIGEVIPCYFPVGQGIKNRAKAIQILKMLAPLQ